MVIKIFTTVSDYVNARDVDEFNKVLCFLNPLMRKAAKSSPTLMIKILKGNQVDREMLNGKQLTTLL